MSLVLKFIAGIPAENNCSCEAGTGRSPDPLIKRSVSEQSHLLSMPLPNSAITKTKRRVKGMYPMLLTSSDMPRLLKAIIIVI